MFNYDFNGENFCYVPEFEELESNLINVLERFVCNNYDIFGDIEKKIVKISCTCFVKDLDCVDKLIEQFEDELRENFEKDACKEFKESKLAQDPYNYYGVDKKEFL